jgi:sugar lactone lactonase YvrE
VSARQLVSFHTGGIFFEGPRWHEGSWWVSDFYTHRVSRISPEGVATTVVEVETQPSGLGWLPDGSLVISSMTDQKVLRFADGRLDALADLSEHCGGYLNDLVVDAAGHIFVGDFGFDLNAGAAPRPTSLKRVDPDGTVTVVADGLYFPNGSVITPDGATLIVAETFGNRCTAWDLAPDGSLSGRREWARFGPDIDFSVDVAAQLALTPDGCALDDDGYLWVADAYAGRAVRVAPGGDIVEEVRGPDGFGVFACALGGQSGHTLLLCAAPLVGSVGPGGSHNGVLFTTDVAVPAPRRSAQMA